MVVPGGVAELLELVEDHAIGPGAANLPALVVDLLDVRFAAGRGDHLGPDVLEPREPLAAHFLGQNGDGRAADEGRVERAAAAVVAGAGPDGFLRRRDRTGRSPAWARGSRTRRRLCAHRSERTCRTRPMIRVSTPVSSGGNSIQLPWLYSPPRSTGSFFHVMRNRLTGSTSHRPTFLQPPLDFLRHAARVAHLSERGQQNPPLAETLDRPR